MKVEITVEGADDLVARFATVEKGLDFRELGTWDAVATEFRKIEYEQFASEGADGASGAWQALSTEYAARKLKQWGQVPIMQASGRLWRSLTQKGSKDAVEEQTATELTLGTTVEYAKYHQSKEPRKKLPRRPLVDLTDAQTARLGGVIQGKMKQLIANAKLRDIRGF
jgi:phage gpG-like protein